MAEFFKALGVSAVCELDDATLHKPLVRNRVLLGIRA